MNFSIGKSSVDGPFSIAMLKLPEGIWGLMGIDDCAYGWTTERVVVTIFDCPTSWGGVGWGINNLCSKNFQLRY